METPSILRTIIKQLLEQHPDIPDHIHQQLQECGLTDDELLANCLFSVISLFPKIFLLIDGVDELGKEEQATVLSILRQLAGGTDYTVKIFVSSRREEPYIVKQLEGFRRIDLSTPCLSSDIAYFVKETVKSKIESGELVIRNPSLEQDIVKMLVDGADGMYVVHLHYLFPCLNSSGSYGLSSRSPSFVKPLRITPLGRFFELYLEAW